MFDLIGISHPRAVCIGGSPAMYSGTYSVLIDRFTIYNMNFLLIILLLLIDALITVGIPD